MRIHTVNVEYKNSLGNYFTDIDSILFHFSLFVLKKKSVSTQRTIYSSDFTSFRKDVTTLHFEIRLCRTYCYSDTETKQKPKTNRFRAVTHCQ